MADEKEKNIATFITPEQWKLHGSKIMKFIRKADREIKGKFVIDPQTDKLVIEKKLEPEKG